MPWVIEDITGNNLYKVTDPNGITTEVHANYIKFYDFKGSLSFDETVRKVYTFNTGSNEVKDFVGLRFNKKINAYEVKVAWRGGSGEDPNWQDAMMMYEDQPELFLNYLRESKDENEIADALLSKLVRMDSSNLHVVEELEKASKGVKTKKKPLNLFPAVMAVTIYPTLLKLPEDDESYKRRKWTEAEDSLLSDLICVYGFGNWKAILNSGRLPGRQKHHVISRVMTLISNQQIADFKGLRVPLKAVKDYNDNRVAFRDAGMITNPGLPRTPQEEMADRQAARKALKGLERIFLHCHTCSCPLRNSIPVS